ncbi:MAG: GNAT family N-acetyltransferase [Alphaproteobacteria bacterium]|nr:GNAT family N-acetyltransferase [Alphaproteobacteria bacterium]
MEYHADRFTDASLILYKEGEPIAILPAEREGDTVYSHRGLTYAGWILSKGLTEEVVEALIRETLAYYRDENLTQLDVRMVPEFFSSESQDHLYAAFDYIGAKRKATVTHHCTPLPYKVSDRGKRWGKRQAKSNGLQLSPSSAIQTFWEEILIPNLLERHGVLPTHSLAEMEYLYQRFPANIRFYTVTEQREMLGGAVVFVSGTTAHLQYTAASPRGRSLRCLDLLVSWLIEEAFPDKAYFNMGVSHIPASGGINHGLVQWKESFGGKPVEVSTYRLSTQLLETA